MPHHDEVTETLTCYWIVQGFGPLVMSREPLPYLKLLAAVVSIHARSEVSVDSKSIRLSRSKRDTVPRK